MALREAATAGGGTISRSRVDYHFYLKSRIFNPSQSQLVAVPVLVVHQSCMSRQTDVSNISSIAQSESFIKLLNHSSTRASTPALLFLSHRVIVSTLVSTVTWLAPRAIASNGFPILNSH